MVDLICPACLGTIPRLPATSGPKVPVECPLCHERYGVLFDRTPLRNPQPQPSPSQAAPTQSGSSAPQAVPPMAPGLPKKTPLPQTQTLDQPTALPNIRTANQPTELPKIRTSDQPMTRSLWQSSANPPNPAPQPPNTPPPIQISGQPSMQPQPVAGPATGSQAMCKNHPWVAATSVCSTCGMPVCNGCLSQTGGKTTCNACSNTGSTAAHSTKCVNHPSVAAVIACAQCLRPICDTCSFPIPGNQALCPTCATKKVNPMPSSRKTVVTWAFVLNIAAWLITILGAIMITDIRNPQDLQAAATFLGLLMMISSIAAFATGLSCLDKRLGNPPIVLAAAIWSIITGVGWLLLTIVGLAA